MLKDPASVRVVVVLQLDAMLEKQGTKVDKVLNFEIDDSVLEERITGRWIHPSSGRSYHSKFAPPKTPGKDDVSGSSYVPSCQYASSVKVLMASTGQLWQFVIA